MMSAIEAAGGGKGTRSRAGALARAALCVLLAVLGLAVGAPAQPAAAADPDRLLAFGSAPDLGSPPASPAKRLTALAAAPAGNGYWAAGSDGAVFAYGVGFHGSLGGKALARPVVAIAPTPSGHGYWLASSDGGVFTFGDAPFAGSLGHLRLTRPIVAMTPTPSGRGYWLAASDGGVFALGDAAFHGSMGGRPLRQPIVGMAATPSGHGYWLVASDGGVFSFGDAVFLGSLGHIALRQPVVGMAATGRGDGYWLAAADGGVFSFGTATFHGSAGGAPSPEPVVAIAAQRAGTGYWLLRSPARPRAVGPPLPANSGQGRRIVYSNPAQRIWLVGDDGVVERTYRVSGRRGVPRAGTYSVFSKSRVASAGHDGITMRNMVRFAHGSDLAIGFHAIPRYANGRPLQSESELGAPRSAGCVRQSDGDAAVLWDWAPIGTTVVVIQ